MRSCLFIAMILLAGPAGFAQQVIQQPVVGVTSANTTVSVPDRGATFIGGVSSAQSGRSQYGPLRSGTSTGISRQSSSISTSVYIHDLRSMDEEILNSQSKSSEGLQSRVGLSTVRRSAETVSTSDRSRTDKCAKFEELAKKADQAGKISVAKLYWQTAATYGSKTADRRLAELNSLSSTPAIKSAAR